MRQPCTILFSGGGSLGHVVPSMAVAALLKKKNAEISCVFVCADREDETSMLTAKKFPFSTIHAPKFPHGFSLSYCTFPFQFLRALLRAQKILKEEKPRIVFSKGGFASVPLCLVAWMKGIPIILHESDSVLSLSSGVIARLATEVWTGFPEIKLASWIAAKAYAIGNFVRSDIADGNIAAGTRITGFSGRRPVMMFIGGSQGSVALNSAVTEQITELLELGDVIHLTGRGKAAAIDHARYFAREIVNDELPHLYALANIVVSRASAGVLSELAEVRKPVIVVPLRGVAHDHQYHNAKALADRGAVLLLPQENLSMMSQHIKELLSDANRAKALGEALHTAFPSGATERATERILALAAKIGV